MIKYKILLFGIIILFSLLISYFVIESRKDDVYKWAKTNSYTVESIESHWSIINTPFNYIGKGESVFEVWVITPTNLKEHWWIRTNLWFGNDYIKE